MLADFKSARTGELTVRQNRAISACFTWEMFKLTPFSYSISKKLLFCFPFLESLCIFAPS